MPRLLIYCFYFIFAKNLFVVELETFCCCLESVKLFFFYKDAWIRHLHIPQFSKISRAKETPNLVHLGS